MFGLYEIHESMQRTLGLICGAIERLLLELTGIGNFAYGKLE